VASKAKTRRVTVTVIRGKAAEREMAGMKRAVKTQAKSKGRSKP
jgi:hypothetical protein